MAPKFTIFSACRNASHYAARSIESVLAQDFHDWQLVVMDDASDDDTWAHISRVCPDDDARIWRFLVPQRRRKLANFLWAFPCFQGDIIVELDCDDWFATPDALSTILAAYEANPAACATCGSFMGYPKGYIINPCTQPVRGQRLMQNGFATSTPAPRTWKRELTTRSLTEMPDIYTDPTTGAPWNTNADIAMYAPATLWADRIIEIDEVLVNVNYESTNHDFREGGLQREEGMRLYEFLIAEEWRINAPMLRAFMDEPATNA